MQTFTKEQFWAELEEAGEDVVRERVVAKVYGELNHKRPLAEEWLRVKAEQRTTATADAAHQLNVEGLHTAKSAKNAAWVAAVCAAIAVAVSTIALWKALAP